VRFMTWTEPGIDVSDYLRSCRPVKQQAGIARLCCEPHKVERHGPALSIASSDNSLCPNVTIDRRHTLDEPCCRQLKGLS
jgi:hypothetical protein